jgi:hypothetical protein
VAILTNRQQLKKYSDYDYAFPPKGSNLRKGPCRARDGVGLLFVNFNGLYCLAVNVAIASLAQHRNYLRITVIPDDVILVAVTIHKTEAHVIISRLYHSMLKVALCSHQYRFHCFEFHNLLSFFLKRGCVIGVFI